MREILFRGKTEQGEWVYGVPIYLRKEAYIVRDFCLGGSYTDDWVKAETVGQYTGLTDKNGKKIFAGDIVKERDCLHNGKIQIKGKIYEVKSYNGCWVVTTEVFWDFLYTQKDLEIIGNIHDNPELLGE
jgi:uncharacterized phage protein (TIGR01671 family)